MSVVIPELSLITERIGVLAPTEESLRDLFEGFAEELMTTLAPGRATDLKMASPRRGPLRAWASFNLGNRGALHDRVSLLGFSMDASFPTRDLAHTLDGWIFRLDPELPKCLEILHPHVDRLWQSFTKPCTIIGLHQQNESLAAQALRLWTTRQLAHHRLLEREDRSLAESLEWILSQSLG